MQLGQIGYEGFSLTWPAWNNNFYSASSVFCFIDQALAAVIVRKLFLFWFLLFLSHCMSPDSHCQLSVHCYCQLFTYHFFNQSINKSLNKKHINSLYFFSIFYILQGVPIMAKFLWFSVQHFSIFWPSRSP